MKTKSRATYTAFYEETKKIIYKNRPWGNLIGELPLSSHMREGDLGTLARTDGGDPFEAAVFWTQSDRRIIVMRDLK